MIAVLVGGGASMASSAALPLPEELPENVVVVVSKVPVSRGRITKAEFQHALLLSAIQAGRSFVPRPGEKGYGRLEGKTVDSMLEAAWIQGEAVERGITVTRKEVARELDAVKKQSFKSKAEYLKFLRESRYTKRDIHERVELQLLSVRLQAWLWARVERESRNEFEENQAIREFTAEFTAKWRARTVCAPAYATDRCSTGPPPSA